MPHHLEHKDKIRSNQRYHIFQTQIHYTTNCNARGSNDPSNQELAQCDRGKEKKGKVDLNTIKELISILGTDIRNGVTAPRVQM